MGTLVWAISGRQIDLDSLIAAQIAGGPSSVGTPVFSLGGKRIDIDRLIADQVAGGPSSVGTPIFSIGGQRVDIDAIIAAAIASSVGAGTDDDPIDIEIDDEFLDEALIDGAGVGRAAYQGSGTYAACYFRFTLAEETSVEINVTGNGALTDTFMIMWKGDTYDTREEWVPPPATTGSPEINTGAGDIIRDDDGGAEEGYSRIVTRLPAGSYVVEASQWAPGAATGTVNFSIVPAEVPPMTTLSIVYTFAQIAASGGTGGSPWLDTIAALSNKTIRRVGVLGTPLTMPGAMDANLKLGAFITMPGPVRADINAPALPTYNYSTSGNSAATVQAQFAGLASSVSGGGPITFEVVYDT